MKVEKVKYVIWAVDVDRAIQFYHDLFGAETTIRTDVWSEIIVANATIGIHSDGEGKRTWTGLSFQLDDLREGIKKLKTVGGDLTREPTDTPEDPLHLAMCVDTEGNEFMMTAARTLNRSFQKRVREIAFLSLKFHEPTGSVHEPTGFVRFVSICSAI